MSDKLKTPCGNIIKEYHSESDRAKPPKQESDLTKEDIADYKKAKKREDDKTDTILSLDDFKKEIDLVDETMGKLVIEQDDEPKPEAKEDEIQEIIGRAVCQGYPCKICEDKGICPKEIQIENGLKVKQARQELARVIGELKYEFRHNKSALDALEKAQDKVRGK